MASTPVKRNRLMYVHINSHSALAWRIGLDWLVLPALCIWGLVELIMICQSWGYIFLIVIPWENFDLIYDDANININDWVDCFLRWYLCWKARKTQIIKCLSKHCRSDSNIGEENFAQKSINFLILLGIKRNFLRKGMRRSFYLSKRRAIKMFVLIKTPKLLFKYVNNIINITHSQI